MNLPVTELLVIVLLTLLEGFFVAAEIALVSVRRSRVDQLVEEGNEGARRVRRLIDEPGRFLAVATMTVEHHDWLGADFVTNCATGATSGKVRGHN